MKRSRLRSKYLKKIMKKIGNCIPNKEIIPPFCLEKLKRLTMKIQMKEKFLIANFFGKQ